MDNAWSALGYTLHYSGVCCVCCVCCISPKDCFCCVCYISPKDCWGIMPGALWGTLSTIVVFVVFVVFVEYPPRVAGG